MTLRNVAKTFSLEEQRIEINEIAQDLANLKNTVESTVETDPIFTASAASNVTIQKITNWDTAYGWGDHSGAGYVTDITLNQNLASGSGTMQLNRTNDSYTIDYTPPDLSVYSKITISDTPPNSPSSGDFWWESDVGVLKIYYQDADSSQWVDASPLGYGGGGSSSDNANVTISDTPPVGASPGDLWWESDVGVLKIYYQDANSVQWVDASPGGSGSGGGSSSVVYPSVSSFPAVGSSIGEFAYASDNGSMYYSNGISWTSQRLVTTNSVTSSDFATLLTNSQLTYTINALDHTGGTTAENDSRKIIRLEDSSGTTDQIVLVAGNGLSINRTGDEIELVNDVANSTYSISAESAIGNADSILRLTDNAGATDDITFAGADGLTVERTDANTITFRAPSGASGGTYTAEDAQDAASQLFVNGTHTGISFTYNDANNTIDATVTGGGSGGTTYDLLGSNTTSNNAILTLRDANNNDDSIEFAGSNGTDISWDSANNRITINSTAPVQPDWDATSGLGEILNKPTIPSAYTLPAATTSTLGGVIPDGTTITVDANGNIAAAPGGYVLPMASPTVLGGIKIGSGLSIDGNGVVSATGGSTVPQIQDLTGTTGSIADNNTAELNITGYKAYALFKITVDTEAWVRVYVDDASRDADLTRSEGQDPTPGSGVIAEVRTSGAESILTSPGIMGFNNDSPRTNNIYLSVTNRSGAPNPITVTLTALQIGE